MSNTDNTSQPVRLNKALALRLGVARREADNLIKAGRVAVNGQIAALGSRIAPEDKVEVDGKPTKQTVALVYMAMNKPVGYVCSRRAQGDNPTIYKLLPADMHHLKPVGRLDQNSSGLLLMTNDGDFAFRMTHPKFKKTKIYKVRLDKDLEPLHQQMIADYGVALEDGVSQLGLERLHDSSRKDWRVNMSEGRNRQVRRTFAALGYTVVKLHRTDFGPYALGDIKPGEYENVNML